MADHRSGNESIVLPAFGNVEAARILAVDELFAVIRDGFPVSPGHPLIIPRRAVSRFGELTNAEKARLIVWVTWVQEYLNQNAERKPDGFNLGVNDGVAAGHPAGRSWDYLWCNEV